jgi:predicted transcriptional regulator
MDKTIDIVKLRVEAGMTQAQLAHAAGCTQATIARIEKGANTRTSLLQQILYVLRSELKNKGIDNPLERNLAKSSTTQCSECSKKEAELLQLKRQISLLIETNAMLAQGRAESSPHAQTAPAGGKQRTIYKHEREVAG